MKAKELSVLLTKEKYEGYKSFCRINCILLTLLLRNYRMKYFQLDWLFEARWLCMRMFGSFSGKRTKFMRFIIHICLILTLQYLYLHSFFQAGKHVLYYTLNNKTRSTKFELRLDFIWCLIHYIVKNAKYYEVIIPLFLNCYIRLKYWEKFWTYSRENSRRLLFENTCTQNHAIWLHEIVKMWCVPYSPSREKKIFLTFIIHSGLKILYNFQINNFWFSYTFSFTGIPVRSIYGFTNIIKLLRSTLSYSDL